MASLRVLAFDPEGRPVAFDTWHDDLQLFLPSDLKDRQHRPCTTLSLLATPPLPLLLLPYLFPELSAFATVADLVTHLRTSDARYRDAVPAEFLPTNQPPMFITLYFIVTRLPDSLQSVRDHFLTLDPTSLTVDLLEQHLPAAETSAFAVGAARGTPRSPFFEGCFPSPLSSSFASAAAADVSVPEDVGAASTSAKHRNSKGKGGRGSGGGSGGGGGGSGSGSGGSGRGGGGSGGGGGGGTGGGGGGSGGGGGGSGGSGGSGGGGTGGGRSGPRRGGPRGGKRGMGEGSETCQYVIRTGVRVGQTCGKFHTEHRCFARLVDAWRSEFGDNVERPRWAQLLQSGVPIFDLDYDVIISAMYALSFSAEGECYRCVPPHPGIAAAALGASASGTPPGTATAEALHTFTLDSGASRCFFRDSTTLTPLPAPFPVRLADPSWGPVVTRSSTVLPCPSGSLSGLHLPSFSTNFVITAALQDALHHSWRSACVDLHVHTDGASPGYTLLWHHRLGHPSLPRLRGKHSRLLVSGLPTSLPPLPPSRAPPCLPCVEGRQRAAPQSSSFPTTTALLQTLHVDVWVPARVSGQGRERYFLLVIDDYTWYTTVFPLRNKGEVSDVLIPWIRTVRLQLRERFGTDLPILRLHSDRGGEFSSDLLRDFCRGEGITQSFTLPDSPQQNGIAERRIGLVMEVARTSMIHAAAPHFLWPFAVRYAAHQLNLWPRVSLPETSPTLRWTGKVGDASVFRFYHPTSRCVLLSLDVTFDESVPFYRLFPYRSAPPRPRRSSLLPVAVVSGAAPGAASGGAVSGGAEPGGVGSEGAGSGDAEPEGVDPGGAESEGAESGGAEPWGAASSGGPVEATPRLSSQQLREWLVRCPHRRSGAHGAGGAGDTGAGGAAVPTGAFGTGGVGCAGAGDPTEPGAASAVGAGAGVAGAGGPGEGGAGAAGAGVGGTGAGGAGAAGAGAVDPGGGGAGEIVRPRLYFVPLLQQVLGVPSTGLPPPFLCPPPDQSQPPLQPASLLPAPSPYTEQSGGLTELCEPASRPFSPVRTTRRAPRWRPPPDPGTHAMALRPSSVPLRVPLRAPPESSLPEVPDPESDRAHAASPTVACLLATAFTDPYFESAVASAHVAELLDFAAAYRLDYATALVAESVSASPPSVRGECALGTDVLEDRQEDFECLAAAVPCFASMLLALRETRMLQTSRPRALMQRRLRVHTPLTDRQLWMPRWHPGSPQAPTVKRPPGFPPAFKARYVARGFNQQQGVDYFHTFSPTPKMTTLRVLLHVAAQRDYELHSQDFSTAFLQGSLHEEIWLRRPPSFAGTFPAGTQWSLHRPVYGLRQGPREWHDTLRNTLAALGFAPSTADSLFLRTDTSLPPFYVLVYVNNLVFATADTEAMTPVKSELQKRHTCTDLGKLHSYLGLQITRDRARRTITLTQSHMVHQVLQRFGFQFSSPQPTPLSTSHLLSAPPSDESVEPSGLYPELVGFLMYLMTCTRPDLAYPLSLLARYVAPVRWAWGLCLEDGVQLSSLVTWTPSGCEAEIYARAMSAQELRWLTYLLTDLGEQPRLPPVLYVDNKAIIALCQEHRLEHRTKHIALRYFLA
ncbi:unnamed protein product [Closterium sp. NIES-53]